MRLEPSFITTLRADVENELLTGAHPKNFGSEELLKAAMSIAQDSPDIDDVSEHEFDKVTNVSEETEKLWFDEGERLISEGKVAVCLLAGGQHGSQLQDKRADTQRLALVDRLFACAHPKAPTWIMAGYHNFDALLSAAQTLSIPFSNGVTIFEQFRMFRLNVMDELTRDASGNPNFSSTGTGDLPEALANFELFEKFPDIEHVVVLNGNEPNAVPAPDVIGAHSLSGLGVTCEAAILNKDDGDNTVLRHPAIVHTNNAISAVEQSRLPSDFMPNYVSTGNMVISVDTLKSAVNIPWRYDRRRRLIDCAVFVSYERSLLQLTEAFQTNYVLVDASRLGTER